MEFDIAEPMVLGAGASPVHMIEFKATVDRKSLNINREAREVDNVILAQVGEAKGHGFEIEQSFIEEMNAYAEKKMNGRVQSNFGHRYDSMGFQLGFFSELRIKNKQWVGKLKVYKAADKSPEMSGMAEWFFEIAEEDPKAVMCSIRFVAKHFYQYNEKGEKVIIEYSWWSGVNKVFADKPAYVAFERLISCDIVDDGALTETLFSSGDTLSMQAFLEFMKSGEFVQFMEGHYRDFPQLAQFYKDKLDLGLIKSFKNLFSKSHKVEDPKKIVPEGEAAKTTTVDNADATTTTPAQEFQAQIDAALKPVLDKVQGLETQLGEKTTELEELKKKLPAATIAGLKTEDPANVDLSDADDDEEWMQSPMNKKVAALASSRRKKPAKQ